LLDVWNDIGITGEYLAKRQDVVVCHLTNIVDEMIIEEEAYKNRLTENVVKAEHEIEQLSRELSISLSEVHHCHTVCCSTLLLTMPELKIVG
jgi:hypothetical protein